MLSSLGHNNYTAGTGSHPCAYIKSETVEPKEFFYSKASLIMLKTVLIISQKYYKQILLGPLFTKKLSNVPPQVEDGHKTLREVRGLI